MFKIVSVFSKNMLILNTTKDEQKNIKTNTIYKKRNKT